MKKRTITLFTALALLLFAGSVAANNINVSNIRVTGQNTTAGENNPANYTLVQFDLSWENSWRTSSAPNNWDAAWVFVKYRVGSGDWQHAWLNNTGHSSGTGTSATIDAGLLTPGTAFHATTNPALGVFIYRSADGTGNFSITGAQLRWNYGANGVADNATVDVKVFAIEMVYVPAGNFYVGSGGTETSAFYMYPTTTNPYQITGEGAITVGTTDGNLYYPSSTYGGDQSGPIPANFPKGYAAFYCQKYEISQQQYVDFLNTLTSAQASTRYPNATTNRHAITVSGGVYSTTNPYVACNFLSWMDGAAYSDWAGLRPMTELEFEKACRG
ncbi:MAG: SUMF1/EgtB/PvdO family nonheme iron enzyme, partial [Bacteroidota bacterium]|nr:SUMF1/EgtB/PvdO family nonheme iron enzyme [Bacteroidota bacterium]